jgi:hypothetical protein
MGLVSLDWAWTRARLLAALTVARAKPGWTLNFDRARVTGFPFRLDLNLTAARLREPSGWAIFAPRLKAEAYLMSPEHWVAVAPEGVVVMRRAGGALNVQAKALRASLSEIGAHPPRISVEGINLTFETPPGARPFFLTSARELHIHTRAGPNNQGAVYLGLEDAVATPSSLFGVIGGSGPVTITLDGIISHAADMTGADAPQSLRAWSQAGGALSLRTLDMAAGLARLETKTGVLTVSPEGRLTGKLRIRVTRPQAILSALATKGALSRDGERTETKLSQAEGRLGQTVSVSLDFEAGRVTLGPISLGPAPRLY